MESIQRLIRYPQAFWGAILENGRLRHGDKKYLGRIIQAHRSCLYKQNSSVNFLVRAKSLIRRRCRRNDTISIRIVSGMLNKRHVSLTQLQRKTLSFKIYTCLIRNIIFLVLIFTWSCFVFPTSFNFKYIYLLELYVVSLTFIRCVFTSVTLDVAVYCKPSKYSYFSHYTMQ